MLLYHISSCFILLFGLCCFVSGQESPLPLPKIQVVEKPKPVWRCPLKEIYARCDMVANPNKPSDINGTLFLTQKVDLEHCMYGHLYIQVNINNVPIPKDYKSNKHGLHVHEYGHIAEGCESCGPHYNPYNSPHGGPWDPAKLRHLGDLGNVRANKNGSINQLVVEYLGNLYGRNSIVGRGVVKKTKNGSINQLAVEYLGRLYGRNSIVGRGVVLHALEDDLGRNKTSPGSQTTGNAGARLACCAITYSPKHENLVYTYSYK